jgi:hypothetical protein
MHEVMILHIEPILEGRKFYIYKGFTNFISSGINPARGLFECECLTRKEARDKAKQIAEVGLGIEAQEVLILKPKIVYETFFYKAKLRFRKAWDNHWVIDGTGAAASIEGSKDEMIEMANAINNKSRASGYRCAVSYDLHQNVIEFWSPRNTQDSSEAGSASYNDALELSELIKKTLENE